MGTHLRDREAQREADPCQCPRCLAARVARHALTKRVGLSLIMEMKKAFFYSGSFTAIELPELNIAPTTVSPSSRILRHGPSGPLDKLSNLLPVPEVQLQVEVLGSS